MPGHVSCARREGIPPRWEVASEQPLNVAETLTWLEGACAAIHEEVLANGCLLITGLHAITTAQEFGLVAERLTPALRDYVGGTSPRSVVHGRIMTATNTPPTWSIILHQEMAYTRTPPDLISFFCARPAREGGQSTLGDMRLVLSRLDAGVRERFERGGGVQLRRTLPSPETITLKPGVQKPWTEVFATLDRHRVDAIADLNGWRTEWLDENVLQLWQDVVPMARSHAVSAELIWSNQAHFWSPPSMLRWAETDGRYEDCRAIEYALAHHPEMLDRVCFGTGEPIPDSDAMHVYDILRSLEMDVLLERSDLLIVDNLMFSHGRRAFAGDRDVLVAIADR